MAAVAADASPPSPGVVVRDGGFVSTDSGERFRPVGFNYIRLFNENRTADHDNFSSTGFDLNEHDAMLRRLSADGFNTVRVFVNFQPGEVIDQRDSESLSEAYLDNVAEFLQLAWRHGVYVLLSMRRHPDLARYRQLRGPPAPLVVGGNQQFMNAGWIRAKTTYLRDFLQELMNRSPVALKSIFAIDIQNEICFYPGEQPFSLNEGRFTALDGRTYDLAADKQKLADASAIHHINACAEAIHEVFPGVPINVNVFTYAAVGRTGPGDFHADPAGWKNRVPFRPLAIVRSQADMIDVHFYSGSQAKYQSDLKSIEFAQLRRAAAASGKPLICGEFGLFKKQFQDDFAAGCRFLQQEWLPVLNRDWSGWLYWTYDTHEQPRLWNAADHESAIYRILAEAAN